MYEVLKEKKLSKGRTWMNPTTRLAPMATSSALKLGCSASLASVSKTFLRADWGIDWTVISLNNLQ